jgi:hypothetical protein
MYAKFISEIEVQYPTDAEFKGIPNWQKHDPALREKGYAPLIGEPEPREGYVASPSRFALHQQIKTKVEPRPYEVEDFDPETGEKTGSHTEWRDTPITVDDSWIEITDWTYAPIPAPPEVPDIDIDDLPADLPATFSKWELIQAWEGTGDLDGLLSSAGQGKGNLLAAWASLPEEIDFASMLTKWAIMVSIASGGGAVSKENIISWLTWIKEHRQ